MSDQQQENDGYVSESRSPRFTLWVAYLIFSTITLGSAVEQKNHPTSVLSDRAEKNQKWVIACSSVTLAFTTIVVLLQLSPTYSIFVVNTKIEGALVLLLLLFWSATVALVSDNENGLAVNEEGAVSNGNLYYFSWAGFITAVILVVSYLKGVFNVDAVGALQGQSKRLTLWAGFLASSLIVMGACASIYDNNCTGDNIVGDTYCKRTKFGIALGAFTTVLSLVIVGMKIAMSAAPFKIEGISALLSVIMFAFGVAFLTSSRGPGAPLGNLYYFTWISFILAFLLVASCFEDFRGVASEEGGNASDAAAEYANGDPSQKHFNGHQNGDVPAEAVTSGV